MAIDAARAKSLFLAVSDLNDPAERAAYLKRECGGDAELLARVEALLRANDAAPLSVDSADSASGTYVYIDPAARVGAVLAGKYKLVEEIGEGGMGSVFMAQQTEPVKRPVAVKVIKAGMDSKAVLARFEAERQALAMMDHPNIAKVLDAGTTDGGRPFFVMELVKGTPITCYCDEHKLTPRQRLELFVPVCQAIQHAHQKGIIHRDIKPSNVLVALYDDRPVPKVIDFGVAKAAGQALTDKTLMTGFGAMVGTPEYMSPEQASLNNLDIDTRSDVYSLGVLLYELLTGTTPVDKKSLGKAALLEILRIVREEEAPRPSAKLSTIDTLPSVAANRGTEPARLSRLMKGELDWLVMKALEKDRSRRYETANGLAQDIQRYLHDEPVQAGPPRVGYRLRKFVKRNRGTVLAATLVLAALVAGIVGTTWGLVEALRQQDITEQARKDEAQQRSAAVASEEKATKEAQEAKTARVHAEQLAKQEKAARERAEVNEKAAKFQAARAESARHAGQLALALPLWEQHDVARAEQVLGQVAWPFRETWEQRHLRDLCRRKALPLVGHARTVNCVALSGDARFVATGGDDRSVRVWDATTGQELHHLKGHTAPVTRVAFSDDGKLIVSRSSQTIKEAGAQEKGVTGQEGSAEIKVWDAATGQVKRTIKEPGGSAVAFSRDGRRIAAGSGDVVKVWDVETGNLQLTLKGHAGSVRSVAFSPDGQRIVSGGEDKAVRVWEVATAKAERVLETSAAVLAVAVSSDGQIASGSQDGAINVWDQATWQKKQPLKFPAFSPYYKRPLAALAFSADGRRVVMESRTVDHVYRAPPYGGFKVWDVTTGQELLALKGHGNFLPCLAIHNDGQRIVSVGFEGGHAGEHAIVWNLAAPAQTLTRKFPDYAALTSDGDLITGRGPVRILDAATGREKRALKVDNPIVDPNGCAISGDGQRVLLGFWNDGTMIVFGATGQHLCRFKATQNVFMCSAISRDGRWVASKGVTDSVVKVWDVATGREKFTVPSQHGRSVAFSRDGTRLAVGYPTLSVWDVATGREILSHGINSHPWAWNVVFSPDGTKIASAGVDGPIRVWDLASGQEQLKLEGHTGVVYCVAFSHDGRRIVSGGRDRTVRVWDAETGQEKLILTGHVYDIKSVAFTRDGRHIVSLGGDDVLRVWDAPPIRPDPRTP